jgi:hypothetical protein
MVPHAPDSAGTQSAPGVGTVPPLVRFFAPFFLPKVIADLTALKEYVGSDEFRVYCSSRGDLAATDRIFEEALSLSWGNVYEALGIALATTLEHRRFGIRLPLLGPLLWVPLTSEFEEAFEARVQALPRRLYADSPSGGSGDRDKLQHFFGSAFLAYTLESRAAAERVGAFIEWGEEAFVVDGALDERDYRANHQGQEFGLRLLEDDTVRPSDFLKFSIVEQRPATSGTGRPAPDTEPSAIFPER